MTWYCFGLELEHKQQKKAQEINEENETRM